MRDGQLDENVRVNVIELLGGWGLVGIVEDTFNEGMELFQTVNLVLVFVDGQGFGEVRASMCGVGDMGIIKLLNSNRNSSLAFWPEKCGRPLSLA